MFRFSDLGKRLAIWGLDKKNRDQGLGTGGLETGNRDEDKAAGLRIGGEPHGSDDPGAEAGRCGHWRQFRGIPGDLGVFSGVMNYDASCGFSTRRWHLAFVPCFATHRQQSMMQRS